MYETYLREAWEPLIYPALVFLKTISPRSGRASRLHPLVSSRSAMSLRGMGIPETWDVQLVEPMTSRQ